MILDCNGKNILIGSRVKILRIDLHAIECLPENEQKDIKSMINDALDVYDIRGQFVCVEKRWSRGNGRIESHSLSIDSRDVELVEEK